MFHMLGNQKCKLFKTVQVYYITYLNHADKYT